MNAVVLKTIEGSRPPGVRIPPSPPLQEISKAHKASKALWALRFLVVWCLGLSHVES